MFCNVGAEYFMRCIRLSDIIYTINRLSGIIYMIHTGSIVFELLDVFKCIRNFMYLKHWLTHAGKFSRKAFWNLPGVDLGL